MRVTKPIEKCTVHVHFDGVYLALLIQTRMRTHRNNINNNLDGISCVLFDMPTLGNVQIRDNTKFRNRKSVHPLARARPIVGQMLIE